MTLDIERLRKYHEFGIRWTTGDEHYKIGDMCRDSYDWNYDMDVSSYNTDDPVTLPGTCAINLYDIDVWDETEEIEAYIMDAVNSHSYFGPVVVIAGDYKHNGQDEDEIIIEDAEVVGIIGWCE